MVRWLAALGLALLLAACGVDNSVTTTTAPTPEPSVPAPGERVGHGQVWVDGIIVEASTERTVLRQGNVTQVEVLGRPSVFESTDGSSWKNVDRGLMVGEHVCMSAVLDEDGTLRAGKTFTSAGCNPSEVQE